MDDEIKRQGKYFYDLKERLPTGISNVRGGHSSQTEWAVFIEDNISATQSTILTPSLRYDYNSYSGSKRKWWIKLLTESQR